MRTLSIVMCGLFLLSAAVQYNDPDPLRWMLAYGIAALLSALAARDRYWPRFTLLTCAMYGAFALYDLPAVFASHLSAYTSFKMRSPDDEVARECIGLLISALWTAYLWRRGRAAGTAQFQGKNGPQMNTDERR